MSISNRLITVVDTLYVPLIQRFVSRDVFGYALCGGVNMLLDAIWYFVIYHYIVAERFIDLHWIVISPHITSLIIVFPITFLTGFWLNRHVAFRSDQKRVRPQLTKYALSVAGSIALNYLLMKSFVELLYIYPTPSKILTSVITALYSYIMGRYFTFKR